MVPARVSGQERNSMVSALHMTFAAGTVRWNVVGRKSEGDINLYSGTPLMRTPQGPCCMSRM